MTKQIATARRAVLKGAAGAGAAVFVGQALPWSFGIRAAQAQGRADTILVISGETMNGMDIHKTGTNRPSYTNAINLYDRLVTFGRKTTPEGTLSYDYASIEPELAESWTISDDGTSITFKLREDATFWDGTPVTAEDVKWSFDRAVSVGGFPSVQMEAGALKSPDQFTVVDEHTFRVDLPHASKLTLPDLAVPVPMIINSTVAKEHATADDPWATEWLNQNPAGGGAYMLERWDPGQQVVYRRFDDWKNGPLPDVQRVIVREVPSAATRRALMERGDADFSLDLPSKDAKELAEAGKLKVTGTPIENCLHCLGMNLNYPPYDNKLVRQAVAYAIPYAEILQAAAYGRGVKMWGADSFTPSTIAWPQPFPYDTDFARAKELLAEAGFPDGFETALSIDLGLAQWTEPTALLIQEGLAEVGISAAIDKIPGANWRTLALVEKKLPLHLENFGGWLNYPDYYFFWAYMDGHLFNSSNYKNEDVERLVNETLHLSVDDPGYEPKIKQLIEIAFEDVPRVPLYQPLLDVAMQPNIDGYEYWFHRQLDVRSLAKS